MISNSPPACWPLRPSCCAIDHLDFAALSAGLRRLTPVTPSYP
jgi:hypothetical protein